MNVLEMLKGGDLRSIGKANEVANLVCDDQRLVSELIEGMQSDDPVLRARCADALEKVSSQFPEYVEPFKSVLLKELSKIDQQEVKWHVALIVPRLSLNGRERAEAEKLFAKWLETERSNIVRVCSVQAWFDLHESKGRARLQKRLKELVRTGTPSLKARSRKLLIQLEED